MERRGLRTAIAAVILAGSVGGLTLVTATPAFARVVKGTGLYSCTAVTGTVSFRPAYRNTGSGTVKAKVVFSATGCVGGAPQPTTVTGSMKFTLTQGSCSAGASSETATSLGLTYSPAVAKSRMETGADVVWESSYWLIGLGEANVTGSYPSPASISSPPSTADVVFDATSAGTCTTGVSTMAVGPGSPEALSNI